MKYTIKEVRVFLRGLEENKYRKRYAIDAKRVHYFANHGVDSTLPPSISKKNENTTYGRDKSLAKEFIKHIKEQEKIKKKHLRQEETIKGILRPLIREAILSEYTDVAKELESTLMDAHIGLGNAQRNILIDLTNQKHGDKEKIPNAKLANKQIQKVKQEFKKLVKLVKVTSFKP